MGHYAFMKAYFLKQASRSCGTKDEKGEAAYLFWVSLSSVKHHARAWTLPLSTQGNDNRRVEMTVVVLLYRTNLSYSVKTHPWCIRVDRLPKPLEEL